MAQSVSADGRRISRSVSETTWTKLQDDGGANVTDKIDNMDRVCEMQEGRTP